jgi:imidazolonepropionase-like amidohydrolase
VVFEHATVIDGTGAKPIEDAVLVVVDGKIHSVGPATSRSRPDSAEVIDASGKTIVPGIINLHVHVGMVKGLVQAQENFTQENVIANLETYARYGVTSVVSLGTELDLILEVRARQHRGQMLGARVFTALQGLTAKNGYPTQAPGVKGVAVEVWEAEQARTAVDRLANKGADFIKIWLDDHYDREPKLTPDLYGAIIAQAHKHGLKVFAHVHELADAKGLVGAGVDVLAHSVRDAEVDDELIRAMKAGNVTSVSTLSRELATFAYADPPQWLDSPFFRQAVPQSIVDEVKTQVRATQSKDPDREINRKGLEIAKRNLKKLSDAGVRIGFGTDSGPPARFAGFFAHLEMELMSDAGLTPAQIIRSFSGVAAETLGVKEIGTLTPGSNADFVVLDGDPLADIRAMREIDAVYIGGKSVQ